MGTSLARDSLHSNYNMARVGEQVIGLCNVWSNNKKAEWIEQTKWLSVRVWWARAALEHVFQS